MVVPAPPCRGRARWWLAAALVVVLAAGGGAWWSLRPRPASAAPGIHAGDLRRYLPAAPTGSVVMPVDPGADGTLTLADLASLYARPAVYTARMERFHFRDAASRLWVDGSGTRTYVVLLRFASVNWAGEQGADLENVNPGDGPSASLDLTTKITDIDESVVLRQTHKGVRSVYGCGHTGDVTYTVFETVDAGASFEPFVADVTALLHTIDAGLR